MASGTVHITVLEEDDKGDQKVSMDISGNFSYVDIASLFHGILEELGKPETAIAVLAQNGMILGGDDDGW